jgi:hypothetical protein
MKKRKYTKEQLEFYFRKLMKQIGRVPTIEDIEAHKDMPSSHVYVERFGSWKKAKQRLGDFAFNKTRCAHCGKEVPFKKITKRFCNKRCYAAYRHTRALEKVPLRKCTVCKKEFGIKSLKDKKRRVCYDKKCVDKYKLIQYVKKRNPSTLTTAVFTKIAKILGHRCVACRFNLLLKPYSLKGSHSDKTILNKIKRNDFSFILLCPNHYEMLKKGFAKLEKKGGRINYKIK